MKKIAVRAGAPFQRQEVWKQRKHKLNLMQTEVGP